MTFLTGYLALNKWIGCFYQWSKGEKDIFNVPARCQPRISWIWRSPSQNRELTEIPSEFHRCLQLQQECLEWQIFYFVFSVRFCWVWVHLYALQQKIRKWNICNGFVYRAYYANSSRPELASLQVFLQIVACPVLACSCTVTVAGRSGKKDLYILRPFCICTVRCKTYRLRLAFAQMWTSTSLEQGWMANTTVTMPCWNCQHTDEFEWTVCKTNTDISDIVNKKCKSLQLSHWIL